MAGRRKKKATAIDEESPLLSQQDDPDDLDDILSDSDVSKGYNPILYWQRYLQLL